VSQLGSYAAIVAAAAAASVSPWTARNCLPLAPLAPAARQAGSRVSRGRFPGGRKKEREREREIEPRAFARFLLAEGVFTALVAASDVRRS